MSRGARDWLRELRFAFLAWLLAAAGLAPAVTPGPMLTAQQASAQQNAAAALAAPITVERGPNAAEQQAKPYVILISLDGFRYDYPRIYHSPNLDAVGARGASAPEGMIPAYPSITFPNHYTIVTGLYPEHHGIVANVFYDPARKQIYSYKDEQTVTDGTWYGGTPLWVLAEQQGMRSACFFWPGSEADIQSTLPTYYMKYDAKFPNRQRVEQVLRWLQLPPERRPHFITLYFSDVDSAGHAHGPDSPEVAGAVREVDDEIGRLVEGVAKLNLRVDVIVLADHGMAQVEGDWINLSESFDTRLLEKSAESFMYPRSEAAAEKVFAALDGKSDKFKVYRNGQVPAGLHFDGNLREGDPVVVATGPYLIRVNAPPAGAGDAMHPAGPPAGMHGYDPAHMAEMKAIFFAAGPDIRRGEKVPPFENVNLYPLVARILGLDISHLPTGKVDGDLKVLQGILREGR
ncbi:MAG TPA: ectonucleotide pyrophosphatase/phosphodiesterase [Candidatus Acidoferrales bacterium]|nr:ectonucleotide pyrophosphatase/phosphodiesterase [Candidatus Acidoferrales bacterium]